MTPSNTMLAEAATILKGRGRWAKGSYRTWRSTEMTDASACYCAMGALSVAATDGAWHVPTAEVVTTRGFKTARAKLAKAVIELYGPVKDIEAEKTTMVPPSSPEAIITNFNDAKKTTKGMVLKAFARAQEL